MERLEYYSNANENLAKLSGFKSTITACQGKPIDKYILLSNGIQYDSIQSWVMWWSKIISRPHNQSPIERKGSQGQGLISSAKG